MKPESHRIATWWYHLPDLQWPDPDNLDKVRRKAYAYAEANVSAAMLFGAHFRWDWLPFFPLLHDYIATVAEELHKYGVKLFDHHSVSLVHRYTTRAEMRHVMEDSQPHLPLSPTFEAAADWTWRGKKLNDWRMIDVSTRKPLWHPQYTGEGFCPRNPEYAESYREYVAYLISETGIDGLSADDARYFYGYNACACEHCRAELQRRAGIDLPPVEDKNFWGNWDNPAWLHWLDLRYETMGKFYEDLAKTLPEGFILTGCGAASSSPGALMNACDARVLKRGWNYINMELVGNTPPYKHDPLTGNSPIPQRVAHASHHQAAAWEGGVRAFCTAFAHSTASANHAWALCKLLDADAWIGTLKTRLGLPRSILDTLPCEEDIVGEAFGFEAKHPELFCGESIGQLGVYFSDETRNHTMFGNLKKGYCADYEKALQLTFSAGLCPHTVFSFPENTDKYPVILLSSVAKFTPEEKEGMKRFLAAGGKVILTGPTEADGCLHNWKLPNRLDVDADQFFPTVPDGVHVKQADWFLNRTVEPSDDADAWQTPLEGIYYHPHRLGDTNSAKVLELVRSFVKPLPVEPLESEGYICTMRQDGDKVIVQMFAEDYDVDINHELDSIRTHRSRVNLLTTIKPIGITRTLRFKTNKTPTVYTPFNKEEAVAERDGDNVTVRLPEDCSYVILSFE